MELARRLPRLFRHKSGRGCFKFRGRFYYCGSWPEGMKKPPAEVEAKYTALVWSLVGGRSESQPAVASLTLHDALAEFWIDCQARSPKEFAKYKRATSFLLGLCGGMPVEQVGPRRFLELQEFLVSRGYSRQGINKVVKLTKTALKWCVSRELFPVSQFEAIKTVGPLLAGKTIAPESKPRGMVSDPDIEATLHHLHPMLAAMVQIQRITGMRPGEVCAMTSGQIDRSEKGIWWYIPAKHKQTWRGEKHARVIGLGPRCQAILAPWLRFDPEEPLFQPRERVADHRAKLRAQRKTKVQPSQADRSKAQPKKQPGAIWTSASYCRAIHAACREAGIPIWSPNQLRKAAAQTVCETVSVEAAADMLGHTDAAVTRKHYLEAAKGRIRAAALQIG